MFDKKSPEKQKYNVCSYLIQWINFALLCITISYANWHQLIVGNQYNQIMSKVQRFGIFRYCVDRPTGDTQCHPINDQETNIHGTSLGFYLWIRILMVTVLSLTFLNIASGFLTIKCLRLTGLTRSRKCIIVAVLCVLKMLILVAVGYVYYHQMIAKNDILHQNSFNRRIQLNFGPCLWIIIASSVLEFLSAILFIKSRGESEDWIERMTIITEGKAKSHYQASILAGGMTYQGSLAGSGFQKPNFSPAQHYV